MGEITLQEKAERLLELAQVNRLIVSSLDPDVVLRMIVHQAARITGACRCVLLLKDKADELSIAASIGLPRDLVMSFRARLSTGLSNIMMQFAGEKYKSFLGVPLITDGKVIGILGVFRENGRAYVEEDEQLLSILADQAAIAILNAQLYQTNIAAHIASHSQTLTHLEESKRYGQTMASLWETVVRQMSDGVLVCDSSGLIIQANEAMEALLGVKLADIAGLPLWSLNFLERGAGGQPVPLDLSPIRKVLRTGARISNKEVNITTGEGELIFNVSASPLQDDKGNVQGVVAVFRDVTQAREWDKLKSNFLSVTSHELRTPLTSIKAYVQLVLQERLGPISPRQRQALEVIESNTVRMMQLIGDILSASSIREGRFYLTRTSVDLADLISEVLSEVGPLATEKGIKVESDAAQDLIGEWDRNRLQQVFMNLLDNAMKYTEPGGRVIVSASQDGEWARVTVADTGRGIDPSKLLKVFEPFYQLNDPEIHIGEGVGLGLAICKGIIDAHSGRIWAESNGKSGTTLKFTLPLGEYMGEVEVEENTGG